MHVLRNLSIRNKLLVAFGLMLALQGVLALTGKLSLASIKVSTSAITHDGIQNNSRVAKIEAGILNYRMLHYRIMLAKTAEESNKLLGDLTQTGAKVDTLCNELSKELSNPEQKELFATLQAGWKKYVETDAPFIEASKVNDKKRLDEVAPVLRAIWTDTMSPALEAFLKQNAKHIENIQVEAAEGLNASMTLGYIVFAIAIVLALALTLVITRTVTHPIKLLKDSLSQVETWVLGSLTKGSAAMAQGDLTVIPELKVSHIEWQSKDEFGQMCKMVNGVLDEAQQTVDSMRTAQSKFGEMVSSVAERAFMVASKGDELKGSTTQASTASQSILQKIDEITNATRESAITAERLATGSDKLAQRSSEATDHLKRLAERAAEIAEGSRQQEEQVQHASQLTEEIVRVVGATIETVQATKDQVEATRQTVDQLAQKQAQIGNIIQTIETIAEQTNLLALNAAIEAARAGEHGRGFAVVADEVRKLAENAGDAAKEIAAIIQTIRAEVDEASKSMDLTSRQVTQVVENSSEAQRSLALIQESGKETADISKANASRVRTMAEAVEDVSAVVAEVATFAQESAAGSEELSATSEEMAASAQNAAVSVRQQVEWFTDTRNQATDLEVHSDELTLLVSKFRLDDETGLASQIRGFKTAHVRWCVRVREMIETGKLIPRADLTDHHKCALGRWYYSDGEAQFGHVPAFKAIEAAHEQVHASAARALDAMEKHDLDAANAAYEAILSAKAQVLHHLDELLEKARSSPQLKAA